MSVCTGEGMYQYVQAIACVSMHWGGHVLICMYGAGHVSVCTG